MCGIATIDNFYHLQNTSNNKKLFFTIDPADYFAVVTNQKIAFIWHTHPVGAATPSEMDIEYSLECQHPFLIYSVIYKNFCFFDSESMNAVYFSI